MKQIKRKEVKTILEELESVRCDICGTEYSAVDDTIEIRELKTIAFVGGYGSIFGDGIIIECDVCQHCMKSFIGEHCRYIYGDQTQ